MPTPLVTFLNCINYIKMWCLQYTFGGWNTDVNTAVPTSFLSPLEKAHSCRFQIVYGCFLIYIENDILCVLIRIASNQFSLESPENT